MLREHGTQRPTVFQLLEQVHHIRGTKSRYRYVRLHNFPSSVLPNPIQNTNPSPLPPPQAPLSPDAVTFRSAQQLQVQQLAASTAAQQARQQVLDTIAPMRRGRPISAEDSEATPTRSSHFRGTTTDEKWSPAASLSAVQDVWGARANASLAPGPSPWAGGRVGQHKSGYTPASPSAWEGLAHFDSNRQTKIGAGAAGFADSFDPQAQAQQQLQPTQVQPNPNRYTMPAPSKLLSQPRGPPVPLQTKPKDAFDGLGLLSLPKNTATGSSSAHSSSSVVGGPSATRERPPSRSSITTNNGVVSAFSRPSTAASALMTPSPAPPSPSPPTAKNLESMSAEERFPSIEQLEGLGAQLRQVASSSYRPQRRSPSLGRPPPALPDSTRPAFASGLTKTSHTDGLKLDYDIISSPMLNAIQPRSTQVTGTAMKPQPPPPTVSQRRPSLSSGRLGGEMFGPRQPAHSQFPTAGRPPAAHRRPRRGGSGGGMAINISSPPSRSTSDLPGQGHDLLGVVPQTTVPGPKMVLTDKMPSPSAMQKRDWLTGEDLGYEADVNPQHPQPPSHIPHTQHQHPHPHPQRMNLGLPEVGGHYTTPVGTIADPNKGKRASLTAALVGVNGKQTSQGMGQRTMSPPPPALPPRPSATREPSPAPTGQPVDNWSPVDAWSPHRRGTQDSSEYEDGPEDLDTKFRIRDYREHGRDAERAHEQGYREKRRSKTTQQSVHDLVDLYGGAATGGVSPRRTGDSYGKLERKHSGGSNAEDLINLSDAPSNISAAGGTVVSALTRAVHLFPPVDSVERFDRKGGSTGGSSTGSTGRGDIPAPKPKIVESTRPQNLFITAAQTTTGDAPAGAGGGLGSPNTAQGNISRHKSPRRGSISDMVSRYEAMSVVSGYSASTEAPSKPKPPVATKPATLKVGQQPAGPNRSPAATSPAFATTSNVMLTQSNYQEPRDVKMNTAVKHRTSSLLFTASESPIDREPPPSAQKKHSREISLGVPISSQPVKFSPVRRASLSPHHRPLPDPQQEASDSFTSSQRGRRPLEIFSDREQYTHTVPPPRAVTPPRPHSPSPDPPYQGVGKLIDQWQKKTQEEVEGAKPIPRLGAAKPGGPRQPQRRPRDFQEGL
jgi:AP2-associated kinase